MQKAEPHSKESNELKGLNKLNEADPAGNFFAACERFRPSEWRGDGTDRTNRTDEIRSVLKQAQSVFEKSRPL
jgi:hypothetical protein